MNTVVVTSAGNAEYRSIEEPKPLNSEVLVKVRRVGFCGSDIHIYEGSNPFTKYPRVIGHELTGEIVKLGENVKKIKIGDRVVVNPVVNCGECDACKRNHPNVCSNLEVLGVHRDGGFSETIAIRESNVYKISDAISWDQAVLTEPFSIGANVTSRLNVNKNDRVLIVGAGVIGCITLMICKMLGSKVVISDIDNNKLENAKNLGADFIVNSLEEDLLSSVYSSFEGAGATAIIDAACIPELFQTMLECSAPGGRVGILGFSQNFSEINQYEITRKELTICGSRLNNNRFETVLKWFEDKKIIPEKIIKQSYPFSDAISVLKALSSDNNGVGKSIITFD